MRRARTEEKGAANLGFQPFGEEKFIDALASCKAVIAGGGFTLMGEAVFLHKPMLAVPLARQFEQVLNARYLEREGFGRWAESLDEAKTVLDFLAAVPTCEENPARVTQQANSEVFQALDEFLD